MSRHVMDIDTDIPNYLAAQKDEVSPDLVSFYSAFEDLFERKLWHQLTLKLVEFISVPASAPFLLSLYENFVSHWEKKMNKLQLTVFAIAVAKQLSTAQKSLDFLKSIALKVKGDESQSAYAMAYIECAHYKLILNDMEGVEEGIKTVDKILDSLSGVESVVSANYYRVCSDYHKAKANYGSYYKNSLLYLSCVNVEELPVVDVIERAHDLALAALLGDSLYNFGELLMHPILNFLDKTEHEWLMHLLFTFNSGDMGKFEALAGHFNKQPLLKNSLPFLRQKLCLLALSEMIFKRSPDHRTLTFKEIANETKLPLDEVEHLLMKSLSLGLIRGNIDQIDQAIAVTWIQPRVLDVNQVGTLCGLLQQWENKAFQLSNYIDSVAPELFTQ